jgi:hypothetical protein
VLKHKLFFKHPDKIIPIKSYFSKTSKKNFIKRILACRVSRSRIKLIWYGEIIR